MATVRIHRGEAERDLFPPICALTGVPTEAVKKKTFAWTPGWTKVLILGGLLPYVVVSLILTKRMAVRLPLREGKHGHWLVRQAFLVVGVLFAINLFIIGGILAGGADDGTLSGIVAMAGILLLLFALITGLVLMNKSIRPIEITDHEMRLGGIHPNFKEALEAMREERRRARAARQAEAPPQEAQPLKARRYEGE
jgi:hypothetical protein